jgi:CRISPR type II-A-associated protein Csn2
MKLVHPALSRPLSFSEDVVQVLTVESPRLFRDMYLDLARQSQGGEGRFVLSQSDVPLDGALCLHVVSDYAHLQPTDRKIALRLQKLVLRTAQEMMREETEELNRMVQWYVGRLAEQMEYVVDFELNDPLPILLKGLNFRVDLTDLSPLEGLMEHLRLFHDLFPNQCFVLVHAKLFFDGPELLELYKMAQYKKWTLLLLEGGHPFERLEGEQHLLIDSDLCEIRQDHGLEPSP